MSSRVPRDVLVRLVEANYAIAEEEEKGEAAKAYFEDLLSPQFVFLRALGDQWMSKDEFIKGLEGRKGRGRRSTGLRLEVEKTTVAPATVVTTADGGEFLNTRLFQGGEQRTVRCVRWFSVSV